MADIGAIVLNKLLQHTSLEGWSRLKLSFFDASYTSIYSAINKYYGKYNRIPNFEELNIYIRDGAVKQNILALKELQVPDEIDINSAIDSLINEYTQNEALKSISKFVDHITLLDSEEVKDDLNRIVLNLDEKTHTDTDVVTADNINIFELEENTAHTRVALGLNNTFDANVGAYRGDFVVFGGKRGAGKSIVCCNISANQYEQGNVVPYFTIEMNASEIFQRNLAILSGVSAESIRNNSITTEDIKKLAKVRAEMFEHGLTEYSKFLEHNDRFIFEANLRKNYSLKENNQLVIIHDSMLTLSSIDIHLQKLKAKHRDSLKVAVIDYMNQVTVENKSDDRYDWKIQIHVAAKLKEFATKYDLLVISPYQIDKDNEARFAKGILDSPDLAYILKANNREDGIMSFINTKVRGSRPLDFHCPISWDNLKISPQDAIFPNKSTKTEETKERDDVPF